MCLPDRMDRKNRTPLAIANLCLGVGLMLWNFREYIHVDRNWLHAACGFLLGLSITINLRWIVCTRRRSEKQL
jgi:hypothetical protein